MGLSAVRMTLGAGVVVAAAALGAPAQAITINDPYGDAGTAQKLASAFKQMET